MYAQWEGSTRMTIAKTLLSNMLDSLVGVDNLEIGLRCYGHQKPSSPQDCRDTKLEVDFGKNTITAIKKRLETLRPKGTTPIARALESGALDFPSTIVTLEMLLYSLPMVLKSVAVILAPFHDFYQQKNHT